jgi:hypothetical protein
LQAVQERWQASSRALPLARNDEQALWRRFRGACDAFFAARKEAAAGVDAERRGHLQQKEGLCARLEAAAQEPVERIAPLLRELGQEWERIGPVPRAAERQIDARRQAALDALQERLDQAQRQAAQARHAALRDKLALCQSVEQKLARQEAIDAAEAARLHEWWQALPALAPELERTMRARLDAALPAAQQNAGQYAELLERNRASLMQDILHLEILTGQNSPPELARERLQMQVEVLQSSFKAGQTPTTQQTLLARICGLPALVDQATAARIEHLISACAAA